MARKSVSKRAYWQLFVLGLGALITVVWAGFLGVLTFRLLTALVEHL